ncbi:MAG: DUF47 family protein [Verrucomicrobia bacterium]|nr:DUF47 family protein [Verrucomicrobiota bacterium]
MFSLQKLLGKDDKFFALLEASAEEGRASVLALKRILTNPSVTPTLDEFVTSRRKDKQITNEISELLCKTFVTTLEREDIEALSNALYRIPKIVEKFAERFILTAPQIRDVDFSTHAAMLEKATETVVHMVKALRTHTHLDKLSEQNKLLQKIEGDADKLILELIRDLYSGKHTPLRVVILKDLYELLEKVVDRCRDAGNVISHVVLKYS